MLNSTYMISKNSININFEKSLYVLLFLFPLFAVSIRHWSSTTFGLLVLLGIIYYFSVHKKQQSQLHIYEKWYLWLLVAYFVSFLISMGFNYPERFSETRFGNEIRFLLVIPLYLLIIQAKDALKWLAYGGTLSILISFGFCLHSLYIEKESFFEGEYSQLFTGPVILIYLVISLSYFIPKLSLANKRLILFLVTLIALASFSIIATQVRAAYIGYAVLAVMFIGIYIKGWKKIAAFMLILVAIVAMYHNSDSIKSRMDVAYKELTNYTSLEETNRTQKHVVLGSVGTRLEMWRASYYFLQDYPILGVGNGNYNRKVRIYIEQDKVNPALADHDHLHNVFVNATVNKGLLGLVVTTALFFFPLFIYLKYYKVNPASANTGILYTAIMFLVSMNESAPFYKSNFVATYLILSIVIFLNHMQAVRKSQISS